MSTRTRAHGDATPRQAQLAQFAEAMAFTDLVFRPGQKGRRIVQRQYPHVYRDEAAYARRLLIVRDAGAIVGCMAVHPLTVRLGAARVRAAGVGIVGTHPDRRGEGIMTRMLEAAIARMDRAGCALSVLGGDRQRYGHFGWENGGVRTVFHVTARSLGVPSPAERRLRLERIPQTADVALCRRIHRLAAARPYAVDRGLGDIHPLLVRDGKEAWTCRDGRRFAYVVAGGPQRRPRPYESVHEFGGDADLALAMIRRLLPRAERAQLSVIAGPDQVGLLQGVSATWYSMCDGMVNILSLPRLLLQLRPELARRAAARGLAASYRFELDGGAAAGDLDLGGGGSRHRVRLDRHELVSLFFGCLSLDEAFAGQVGDGLSSAALAGLARILPLPLHIPSLDHT